MKRGLVAGFGLALALAAPAAWGHALAPALLELREVAPQRYAVHWRTTVVRAGAVSVAPRLPAACAPVAAPDRRVAAGEAVVVRWLVQCPARGLAGETIAVDGLADAAINVVLTIVPRTGATRSVLLGVDAPSHRVPASEAPPPVFGRYLRLGSEHLIGGVDHLLFLLGLFVLLPSLRTLVAAVTAFTAGHAATLALVALGVVPLAQDAAELAIAATVLVLAGELARPRSAPPTLLHRRPWLVAGLFGLVHGLGFAGALRDVGLPPGETLVALLAFNLGIEAAQLAVIAALLAGAALAQRVAPALAATGAVRLVPAYGLGTLAAFWCFERSWAWWGLTEGAT